MDAVRRQLKISGPRTPRPDSDFADLLHPPRAARSSQLTVRPDGDRPHTFNPNTMNADEARRLRARGRSRSEVGPAARHSRNTFLVHTPETVTCRPPVSGAAARRPLIAETRKAMDRRSGFRSFSSSFVNRLEIEDRIVCQTLARTRNTFLERENAMRMRVLPVLGCLAILIAVGAGCSSMSPPAFPSDIGAIAKTVAVSMADQGVWNNMAADVSGHVTNPGLRVSGGVEYFGSARFVGVSGQVGLSGQGGGTGVITDEARSAILKLNTEKPEYTIPAIPNLTSKATSGESASVAQPPGGG